ncbi:MAG: nicotinate phosphoribosyltransferase [Thermodesulfobacteriota bacterium]
MKQDRFVLPASHRPYTDAYFLRAREILAGEGLNPRVTMQVFIRDGPGQAAGLEEAAAALAAFTPLARRGGSVHGLPEGAEYAPKETLMRIEGPIQDFIELETLYLGILSAAATLANGEPAPDPDAVLARARAIRELAPDKRIMYFGSRHWRWDLDEALSRAAVQGGFDACSTDAGARAAGLPGGVGTIPHALVLCMAHAHGRERATAESTLAFHRHVDPAAPRIALVDTFCREIDDTLACARRLGRDLWGVRLDTAGEAMAQGSPAFDGRRYWTGPGVTVELTRAVRRALDESGFGHVRIVLSSGFGSLEKLAAFREAEERSGRLFDALGVGGLYESRAATADIVRVEGRPLAKTGRVDSPNPRLIRYL